MSAVSPGANRPEWEAGKEPKPAHSDNKLASKVKPTEEQLPEGAKKLSPRAITNKATANLTTKHVVEVALPKLSKREKVIDNFIDKLFYKTLPTAKISVPSILMMNKENTFGLDENDPYIYEKIPLLQQLEASTSLTPDRKNLLREMLLRPERIVDELPKLAEITIGSDATMKGGFPIGFNEKLGKLLKSYIVAQNPKLGAKVDACMNELLYAACHTPGLDVKEDAKCTCTFELEKTKIFKPDTILITRTIESEGKTIRVQCRYDISNNKMTFT